MTGDGLDRATRQLEKFVRFLADDPAALDCYALPNIDMVIHDLWWERVRDLSAADAGHLEYIRWLAHPDPPPAISRMVARVDEMVRERLAALVEE